AADRQSTTSASGGEKPTPSAASSSVLPSARDVQQPTKKSQAAIPSRVVERGGFTTRAASLARRGRRATIGRRVRWRPPTSRPQQQTPERTAPNSGRRNLLEPVAVAVIEGGTNAMTSTTPKEVDESGDLSVPSSAAPSL